MYGIKETKEAVVLGCLVADAVDKTMADGVVSVWDSKNFISVVAAIKPAFEGGKYIGKELGDLDESERAELSAAIAENLDLSNDVAESLIEGGLDIVLRILAHSDRIAMLRNGTVSESNSVM